METGNYHILKLDDKMRIVGLDSARTSGLAHQAALRITDDGFRCKIIDPEDGVDVEYLYNQIIEKREMGFIEEYGRIPNGSRKPGDGCRTVGNMIYPAFGGMLEGVKDKGENDNSPRAMVEAPLSAPLASSTLSSIDSQIVPKKIVVHIGEHGLS